MAQVDRLLPALGPAVNEGHSNVHHYLRPAEIAWNRVISSAYCHCQTFLLEFNIPPTSRWRTRSPGCLVSGHTVGVSLVTPCVDEDVPCNGFQCQRDVGYRLPVARYPKGRGVTNVHDVETQSGRHIRVTAVH